MHYGNITESIREIKSQHTQQILIPELILRDGLLMTIAPLPYEVKRLNLKNTCGRRTSFQSY